MRICIIAEGCYPYVVGGVSSWIHNLIRSFPKQEFVILSIVVDRSWRGKYVYDLPDNVIEIHELYLEDSDWGTKKKRHKKRMSKKEYHALRSLLLNQQVEWETLFDLFQYEDFSISDLLMGEDFLKAVTEYYNLHYNQIVFSDFLWTMRSIYLPLFLTLKMKMPKADLYHCLSTGYAGVLGCMAKYIHGGRLLISEHGIYTREREEELIKSKWIQGIYKNIWIEQFRKMSKLAYTNGSLVTSLYEHARELQIELDCPPEKTMITPNGVSVQNFQGIPGKQEEDEGKINVGAVLRISPIKDVKTMIQAFGFAKEQEPALKLWVMGPWEEEKEYAQECFELVDAMNLQDVVFTGRINVKEYLGRMDMTLLTSISEGQPLSILESFAAGIPVIATDVGNCKGLILGDRDDYGSAGIITHIMNVEEITRAILKLAHNESMRREMGSIGLQRVKTSYQDRQMEETYRNIYRDFSNSMGLTWEDENTKQKKIRKEGKEQKNGRHRR